MTTKFSSNVNLVVSFNLFHLDPIDDISFEINVNGNSRNVTVTEKKIPQNRNKGQTKTFSLHQSKRRRNLYRTRKTTTFKQNKFRQWVYRGRNLCGTKQV